MLPYIYEDNIGLKHSYQDIQVSLNFSDLFVRMSRANSNSFGSFEQTKKQLIQNHPLLTSTTYWGDMYFFN